MKKYRIILILFCIGIASGPVAGAKENLSQENLDQILSKIQAAYAKLNDLQARFVQTVRFKDFDTPYISKGRLFLKKGRMRWDYQEPTRQQIFVEGEKVLYYIPEHKQIIISRIGGESDSHLPLQLLTGTGRLEQTFEISIEETPPPSPKSVSLRLVPKNREGQLTKIIATVDSSPTIEGLIIQKVTLYEENGNISTFSFDEIEINKGFPEDLFNFKIPKGIEVIESP